MRSTVKHKFIFGASLVGLIVAVSCTQIVLGPNYAAMPLRKTILSKSGELRQDAEELESEPSFPAPKLRKLSDKYPGLDSKVLELAQQAYNRAREAGFGSKDILTVVDYSLPSTKPRMWVIDMRDGKLLHHTHVAHGIGSGDNYARRFSNQHGSRMSSLGLFVTADLYNGHYGKSLNLHGLDGTFNSNALARRIVVHPAHYVSDGAIRQMGRLGRSFGCLALNPKVANEIMHQIKGGSLIFCYYPDHKWLSNSKFVV